MSQQISSTAQLIAKAILLASHRKNLKNIVPYQSIKFSRAYLAETSSSGGLFCKLAEYRAFQIAIGLLERIIKPGLITHYIIRKCYIEKLVRAELDTEQYEQLVVVGAGLDTLSLRIQSKYPSVDFFEIDFQQILAIKEKVTRDISSDKLNIQFIQLSGKENVLQESLDHNNKFHVWRKTLFIAEGLTMYMQLHEIEELLRIVARNTSNKIIFSFLEPIGAYSDESLPICKRFAERWLKKKGENYCWSMLRDDLPKFTSAYGIHIESISEPLQIAREYLSNTPETWKYLPRDESIALASVEQR